MIFCANHDVYLACGSTDMRKSINGLVEVIVSKFSLDPFSSSLFVFCNRCRDIIKIIEWDSDGFWLHMKRLEKGHFMWPESLNAEHTMPLKRVQLDQLLEQTKLARQIKREPVWEQKIH